MTDFTHCFCGQCHCRNLAIRLGTDRSAAELPVRCCGCGFCRRHGARTVTDADGFAVITLHDPDEILFYRFGRQTADFLICRVCGVYGAAVIEHDGRHFATLNINLLCKRSAFPPPLAVLYDGETAAARRARRARSWTPARLVKCR